MKFMYGQTGKFAYGGVWRTGLAGPDEHGKMVVMKSTKNKISLDSFFVTSALTFQT
jgi:hypothetical protein